MDKAPEYDVKVAEAVLDAVEAAAGSLDPAVPCAFEELTAEPGEMPRLMLKPLPAEPCERRYVSGEEIRRFPFSATLRVAAESEQDRLDAHEWLKSLAKAFVGQPVVLEGLTVFQKAVTQVPTCLGRTERFEDLQTAFDFKYRTTGV